MSEHPHATLIRAGFERFVGGDVEGLLGLFATDTCWLVPGTTAVSGEYCGRDEILAFLHRNRELTNGTYRVELLWVVADDERAVAVYRALGERGDRTLDIEQALLVDLDGGRWAHVRAQPLDQAAFDRFWS